MIKSFSKFYFRLILIKTKIKYFNKNSYDWMLYLSPHLREDKLLSIQSVTLLASRILLSTSSSDNTL